MLGDFDGSSSTTDDAATTANVITDETPYKRQKIFRISRPDVTADRIEMEKVIDTMGWDVMAATVSHLDVRVNTADIPVISGFRSYFDVTNIEVLVDDVQEWVDKGNKVLLEKQNAFSAMSDDQLFEADTWFSDYHKYPEIKRWYRKLARDYQDLITYIH
ncbi:hypothetical protein HDU76_012046 [Blyttiomyces sp. JEL0837]|nr:hypothetical protein HDU76_012046 [Blyttiomyces sp. JEL0837]